MAMFDDGDGPSFWDKYLRWANGRDYDAQTGESAQDVRTMQDARASGRSNALISGGLNLFAASMPGVYGTPASGQLLAQAAAAPDKFNDAIKSAREQQYTDARTAKLREEAKQLQGWRDTWSAGRVEAGAEPAAVPTLAPSGPVRTTGTEADPADPRIGVAIRGRESDPNGPDDQRNPLSTAQGRDQFIAPTWLNLARKYMPDRVAGMTEQQILDLRNDPAISAEMRIANTRENAGTLRTAGVTPDGPNLVMAHAFGPDATIKLNQADAATPAASVLGEKVIRANPQYARLTVGDVRAEMSRRMERVGGGAAPAPGGAPAPGAPAGGATLVSAPGSGAPAPAGDAPAPAARRYRYTGPFTVLNSMPPEMAEAEYNAVRMMPPGDASRRLADLGRQVGTTRVMTPEEARAAGLRPGTVGEINRVTGQRSVLQSPDERVTYQTLTPEEAARIPGTVPGRTYQRSSLGQISEATSAPPVIYQTLSPEEAARLPGAVPGRTYQRSSVGQISEVGSAAPTTYTTLSPEEAAAAGFDRSKRWQKDSNGRITEVGGGGVNVNVNTGETSQRRINEARTAFETKRSALGDLSVIESLANAGVRTGSVDALTMGARGFLAPFMSEAELGKLSQQQLLAAASQRLSVASLPPGPASDRDVALAMTSSPNVTDLPSSLALKAATLRQALRYEEDRINEMESYATQRQPDGSTRGTVGFDAHWRQQRPEIIPRVRNPGDMASAQPGTVVRLPPNMPPEMRRDYPNYPFYIVPERD